MPEEFAKDIPQQRVRRAFVALIAQDDAAIDLAYAALLIAAEEYPDLNIAHCLVQLDHLAERVRAILGLSAAVLPTQLPQEISPLIVIDAMNQVLFEQEHFHGNSEDYYNPSNSFLNDVLEKRQGIPITLSLVYMEVGRRVGLEIFGIGLPFHFIVRCNSPVDNIYIDPYEKGRLLNEQDCRERLYRMLRGKAHFNPDWLEPVSHKQLLVRMLGNLKHIYIHHEDYLRALSVCDRILLLAPDTPMERRDRGIIHFHLKHYARALHDLSTYLDLSPNAEDAEDVQQQIKSIRQIIAMMN